MIQTIDSKAFDIKIKTATFLLCFFIIMFLYIGQCIRAVMLNIHSELNLMFILGKEGGEKSVWCEKATQI